MIPGVIALFVLLEVGLKGASQPYGPSTPDLSVSLNPANLPYYGLRTLLRMAVALLFSFSFTLIYATGAARVRGAERVMIPILDFLQSLPILGFLTATTATFLGLFRGSLLGLEATAVFAIFTSQVWNMTFSFYASLTTQPKELQEAALMLRLSPWQRFWKLDVPHAVPGLIWNTMMSVAGGWFFVVASEVISVVGRDKSQFLPGVGSYVALAIQQADVRAMVYAGLTVLLLVLLYDQLFFRPLVAWSEKFKLELSEGQDTPQSWVLSALQRARFAGRVARLPLPLWEWLWLKTALGSRPGRVREASSQAKQQRWLDWVGDTLIAVVMVASLGYLLTFLFGPGLGLASGKVLRPNPNLNSGFSVDLARRFGALGTRGVRKEPDPLALSYRIALGIGLHNLGEGLAIGAAFALGEAALGTFLVLGFTLHNITEGVGIVAPVVRNNPGLRHFGWLALLAGGPAILGVWLGGFAFNPVLATVFLAVGIGAILQVIWEVGRLVAKDSAALGQPLVNWVNLAGLTAGIGVMYLTAFLVKF
ncbi:hypothetical protein MGR01S_06030 [Meiothermus granaticius NBRC 107808]|uniref:Zinc transporter ZupT n=1 Tax=Meiothermus granaticius NBRC 107808 TaxID=1227551 RepID=A0A399FBG3_9DEIN|nr:Zinc transporter ZupT [Meiothermus granaticius NBRC 107808]GEM85978.1 hypothetical protein MGR01S_06030 [Meiothermus granaticius NBRC 107808]